MAIFKGGFVPRRTEIVTFPDSGWSLRITKDEGTDAVMLDLHFGDKQAPTHSADITIQQLREMVDRIDPPAK